MHISWLDLSTFKNNIIFYQLPVFCEFNASGYSFPLFWWKLIYTILHKYFKCWFYNFNSEFGMFCMYLEHESTSHLTHKWKYAFLLNKMKVLGEKLRLHQKKSIYCNDFLRAKKNFFNKNIFTRIIKENTITLNYCA